MGYRHKQNDLTYNFTMIIKIFTYTQQNIIKPLGIEAHDEGGANIKKD